MTLKRLILGTAQLGMHYGVANESGAPDRRRTFDILSVASELGIGSLDTAPDYGRAEQWIGEFMAGRSAAFEITTKLPAMPANLELSALRAGVEAALTGSLRRLRIDRVDCYLVHRAADLEHYGDRLLDTLEDQVLRGRVLRLGVSAYTPDDAEWLERRPSFGVLQHPLNLLDRRLLVDPVFGRLRARGVSIEARSVLLQGALALAPEHAAIGRIGAAKAMTELRDRLAPFGLKPADAALPFVLAAGADRALVGAESRAQLEAWVTSLHTAISPPLLAAIMQMPQCADRIIDPRAWAAD